MFLFCQLIPLWGYKISFLLRWREVCRAGICLGLWHQNFQKDHYIYRHSYSYVRSFVYRDYVSGHLFGFFMKSRIPPAYFQMAKVMNDDKREVEYSIYLMITMAIGVHTVEISWSWLPLHD